MKNQYMFFSEELFENFDLNGYKKTDIAIPQTNVHIYGFECEEENICKSDMSMAEKLDELTQRLADIYGNSFRVVNSESSQFFCGQIYPLIVSLETKLRYALYISRSLFENGNIDKDAFRLNVGKKQMDIEEADFGEIYEAIFTDKDFQGKVSTANGRKLTKADLIKKIQEIDESSTWRRIVGTGYNYIESHFLEIIDYRNDVMHNHLISYDRYKKAQKVIQQAINELEKAIRDKLISNNSEYLNDVNVFEVLSGFYTAIKTFSTFLNSAANSEYMSNITNALALFATNASAIGSLPDRDDVPQMHEEKEDPNPEATETLPQGMPGNFV